MCKLLWEMLVAGGCYASLCYRSAHLNGPSRLRHAPPKRLSDLTNGPTSREFTVCPFFKLFFGGITTEEGFKKGDYDLLKRYIGLFLSPSSVVYPLKKDSKRAISLFQRSRASVHFPEIGELH